MHNRESHDESTVLEIKKFSSKITADSVTSSIFDISNQSHLPFNKMGL